jgi:hypothetical protein
MSHPSTPPQLACITALARAWNVQRDLAGLQPLCYAATESTPPPSRLQARQPARFACELPGSATDDGATPVDEAT